MIKLLVYIARGRVESYFNKLKVMLQKLNSLEIKSFMSTRTTVDIYMYVLEF